MRTLRRVIPFVLLVGCATELAPPPADVTGVPSRERHTADITESIGVRDDGTMTRVEVYLHDRLGEAPSIELVDGDYLVMSLDDVTVVLERAPQVHAWETMIHYMAEVARTDVGEVGIELRRSDGSRARSTVIVPRAFEITHVPPVVRAGDVVDIGLATTADGEVWGHTAVQCDGSDATPTGTFYHPGDGSMARAGIPASDVPDGAAYCDANLTIAMHSHAGTYDAALGNPENQPTLGMQQRTARIRYYP